MSDAPPFEPIASGTSMLALPKTSLLTDGQRDGDGRYPLIVDTLIIGS